jgi:hypothetical protein
VFLSREEDPPIKQLIRWVALLMKWPEVVRWLQSSPSGVEQTARYILHYSGEETMLAGYRLMLLEDLGKTCKDLKDWQCQVENKFQITADTFPWIQDDGLKIFFEHEAAEKERLSTLAWKGLY